jgi:enoyl-CoA hydratase/carnithine racemase
MRSQEIDLYNHKAHEAYSGKNPAEFDFQSITYQKDNGVATLTSNRPEVLNAVNHRVLSEMNLSLKDASWDNTIGVLALAGAGEHAFCTGADLNEQQAFIHRPRDYWKWKGDGYYLMAEMFFPDSDALQAGLRSPEMAAPGENLNSSASNLVKLIFGEEMEQG